MGEINHFSHKQHPLSLIQNWEEIAGFGDDQLVINCYCCRESISSESAIYGCIQCHYVLHKACAELEPNYNHPFHPEHALTLIDVTTLKGIQYPCPVCGLKHIPHGFLYICLQHPEEGSFCTCINCYVVESTRKAKMAALRKEATKKLNHEGHPHHTLTLQLRLSTFQCDACKVEDKDYLYQCDSCDFWIHKTCATLSPTIDLPHHLNHPLVLIYSPPENNLQFRFTCAFCDKRVWPNDWLYHCKNCRYFAHIKCALNAPHPSTSSAPCDVEETNDFLQFPMLESFTDPLKLLHHGKMAPGDDNKKEISHWSHHHKLILNVEHQGNDVSNTDCSDAIKVCNGCVRPSSLPYYSCKDGCSFTLHKYCVELPPTLEHQLHRDHPLHLVDTKDDIYYYQCNGCFSYGNAFAYKCEICSFYLDINCAFLPGTIKHESHKHPLIQVIDKTLVCKACNYLHATMSYACKDNCDFLLGMRCAIRSPRSLAHRYCKDHEIPLTYPPVEDHPEDFYCDICETEMHPKLPLYHCLKCKNSFHLHCLSRVDQYENTIHTGTIVVNYHKHPLTLVRRKKTPRHVCHGCNLDCNSQLILECRTGTCPYRVCFFCHKNNRL